MGESREGSGRGVRDPLLPAKCGERARLWLRRGLGTKRSPPGLAPVTSPGAFVRRTHVAWPE